MKSAGFHALGEICQISWMKSVKSGGFHGTTKCQMSQGPMVLFFNPAREVRHEDFSEYNNMMESFKTKENF